jgi:hypothetical protein
MNPSTHYFVFDVESIGLHGEGFAVAYVVVDSTGAELETALFSCPPAAAMGADTDRAWVAKNVPSLALTHSTPAQVRAAFWQAWLRWRTVKAGVDSIYMVADCAWPVEARFLNACVDDAGAAAHWLGPYPLLDVSTLTQVLTITSDSAPALLRSADAQPSHHPLADARHSARTWLALMERVGE